MSMKVINQVHISKKYYGEALPASSTIGVSRLSDLEWMVELETFPVIEDSQ